MNILLISQCDKRALTQTRRILDQFAERRGDRTWQTAITQEGLQTLRRLLRQSARKNTSVACHWIRGLDHSELLWIVGDASRFNTQGAVPTNATSRNVLRRRDENDWHTAQVIQQLTMMAALLHDLGKASEAFQDRLRGTLTERNHYRHEWVSLRLFQAFVGQDDDATWLNRLITPGVDDNACWLSRLQRDGLEQPSASPSPFAALAHAPLATAVGWLVVTHHRLPVLPRDPNGKQQAFQLGMLQQVLQSIHSDWNEPPRSTDPKVIAPYWDFPQGLPVTTDHWRKRAARTAQNLLKLLPQWPGGWLDNPFVMHVSRLCLMLADHHYSSLTDPTTRYKVPDGYPLYANTKAGGAPNQTLDEHLLGVAQHSGEVTYALPRFDEHLPRLARHKRLKQRAQDERFRWQNKASEVAAAMRERSQRHGAFMVNMASTGCGKTLANARIMNSLADPERGMRCTFAMGLRTLTLQTGRAFRDLLGLEDDQLAIRVGGSASRALFEHYEKEAEAGGSASTQALIDDISYVFYEANHEDHPLLERVLANPQVRALLLAPLLVCTIDHLTPATESERGGHQIAPMLRLMSSDLVLDEPDDFDINDLPALTRLVHWAGLLGARVLLSSATLPPALIQGLFAAYSDGRAHFQRNRAAEPGAAARPPTVCCLWCDEQNQTQLDCATPETFQQAHEAFVDKRVALLAKTTIKRRADLLPLSLQGQERSAHHREFAAQALSAALRLHVHHHSVDPVTGHRVSFGLIRMANISPLIEVALAFYKLGAPEGFQVHLCTYHANYPDVLRSAIEHQLDQTLNRRNPEAVFKLPEIRARLDTSHQPDQLFVVLGSPVTEVGRDHDYDWAVVEPSSIRSLIQLAGRVLRHRDASGGLTHAPNLLLFDRNLRSFRGQDQPAFCRPGFESADHVLQSHSLRDLLEPDALQAIDARPRIKAPTVLRPRQRLVDLEHARLAQTMLPTTRAQLAALPARPAPKSRGAPPMAGATLNASTWWSQPPADALLTGLLQQKQPFREQTRPTVELLLKPSEDGDSWLLVELLDQKRGLPIQMEVERSTLLRIPDEAVQGDRIQPWGPTDYLQALKALAESMELDLATCASRYGTVNLLKNDIQGWTFHAALGFGIRA